MMGFGASKTVPKPSIVARLYPFYELYKTDFYAWTEKTAELLRQGRFAELDSEELAEELIAWGRKNGAN